MTDGITPVAPSWCLAQLKPKAESVAVRNLERQGFEVFLPRQWVTRRRGGRFRDELAPLFPGYLFVETSTAASPWRRINSTLGIARLVQFGTDRPAAVHAGLIASLRTRCDDNGALGKMSDLAPGDKALILRGPFADFVARVEGIDESRRIWMLLELLGRQTLVVMPIRDVAAT